LFGDWSARDVRRPESRLPFGFANGNGEVLATDSLASMAWLLKEQVSYASRRAWIRPGDVLGPGTFGGGCLAEFWGRAGRCEPSPLRPGDGVTYTVEGIGTISNRVVPASTPPPVPAARTRPRGARHLYLRTGGWFPGTNRGLGGQLLDWAGLTKPWIGSRGFEDPLARALALSTHRGRRAGGFLASRSCSLRAN